MESYQMHNRGADQIEEVNRQVIETKTSQYEENR